MAIKPRVRAPKPLKSAALWSQAGHDLRQPLQSIALFARVLEGQSLGSEQKRNARMIGLIAQTMEQMLEALTMLSKLEQRNVNVEAQAQANEVDLAAAVALQVAQVRDCAVARRLPIRSGNLDRHIRADAQLLAEALKGMLMHAIKSSTGGEIEIVARPEPSPARQRVAGDVSKRGNIRGKSSLVLDVLFQGPDPTKALQRNIFIELPPPDKETPVVTFGLGLAAVSHLAVHAGFGLSHGRTSAGKQRLTLNLQAVD